MNQLIDRYKKLKEIDLDTAPIPTVVPIPTEDDYRVGTIERYFIQKKGTKGYPIFEIGKGSLQRMARYQQYSQVTIKWRITGPLTDLYVGGVYHPSVITTNSKAVKEAAKRMPDIERHLVNLKQFHR